MSYTVSRRLLAALVLVPFAAAPAFAEEEAPLDSILVIGQRDRAISIEPRGLSVSLGDAQFRAVNAFNVEDLIKYAPDFFVRTRFIGDNNAVPGFRGTHSTQSARALVMVDGFVVSNFLGNSFSFPPAWGVVSPTEVRQFDIVYGPYSARYSGNSMGGIVNITTRAPERTEAFGTVQGFIQPYRQYGTKETLWGGSAEAGFGLKQKDGPFSIRVSGRRLVNDGQPMQFYQLATAQPGSAATPISGGVVDPALITKTPVAGDFSPIHSRQDQLRTQIRFDSGDVHVEALFTYWWNEESQHNPRTYLRDGAGAPFYGSTANGGRVLLNGTVYTLNPASNFNITTNTKNEWLGGIKLSAPVFGFDLNANLSTLQFDRQTQRRSSGYVNGLNGGPGQLIEQGPTDWYTLDLSAERTIGAHAIAFGINANRYRTDQFNFATARWREATGRTLNSRTFGKSRMVGLFAEDVISVADGLTVTPGIRADFWRAYDAGLIGARTSQLYAPRRDHHVDPKLSTRWAFAPDWAAELSLATATRYPTVGELYQGSFNGDGSFNINSFDPNLKAERSRDANALLRRRLGRVTITGSLFYQRVENAIFQYLGFNQNGVSVQTFKNIDRTRQYGAELIVETRDWPVEGLDIDANAAWIDAITAKNRADPASEGVQFPRIPRWRINGNLRYRIDAATDVSLGGRYASRPNSDIDGLQRGDTYGYASELLQIDARINHRIARGFRISAGVNNLTNDKAWVFHPYPQRTFTIEAGWSL
ncbi:TonB-dependent receptor [Rhizorhabdus dicambivorans]|uniref:TonB-dependent receptor n=1 Tax=Rhizorhabdus dicambivorans TaxID=1850238 RepID=A0A2A4G3L4_9SPHN|nr:TonB-dependent receptor [Rhizorhabdus dicambivorans]ATE65090.1 TonB-dependent receptor [Rhizorhabdus dicambivorans]PCE44363.1 TonB-dependent receptor [Rhizorhabdus dicambivorans]